MNLIPSDRVSNLPRIFYKDQPVLMTKQLAEVYETTEQNIRKNYSRNEDRFTHGKHFFRLEGDELKDFVLHLTNSQLQSEELGDFILQVTKSHLQISSKTRSLMLWTARGAARHAKLLETDKAWEVFEALEDHYFNHPNRTEPKPNREPNPVDPYLVTADLTIRAAVAYDGARLPETQNVLFQQMKGLAERQGIRLDASAIERHQERLTEHPSVRRFWQIYAELPQQMNHSHDDDLIAINLKHCEQVYAERTGERLAVHVLQKHLPHSKTHRFIAQKNVKSRLLNKTLWCWVFKAE
jgi:hypothetical protein